jgi:hypothetical protein
MAEAGNAKGGQPVGQDAASLDGEADGDDFGWVGPGLNSGGDTVDEHETFSASSSGAKQKAGGWAGYGSGLFWGGVHKHGVGCLAR